MDKCLDLMAVLAKDHASRRDKPISTARAKPDKSYAGFGEVLARIDLARLEAEAEYERWKALFQMAMKERFVISEIPPASILARLLSDLEVSPIGRDMIPSLSVILSLWHRGVTNLLLEESETLGASWTSSA